MKGIYLVGGYPDRGSFIRSFNAVAESGADFIEVGIPFNDPVADGPVIAKAILQAADNGITADMVLEDIRANKKPGTAVYVMTYANIIYSYGIERFSQKGRDILDGLIIADCPNRKHQFFYERGLDIPLVPFGTLESRELDFDSLSESKGDFLYFVGLRGITGAAADFSSKELHDKLSMLRERTRKKVIIGFGVKTRKDAARALALGDGFVVGTEAVRRQDDENSLRDYLKVIIA